MGSSSSGNKLLHLQGLRGFAILAVVLFHFFPTQFSNGYIGVDMFFLFSGYLMTMMVSRNTTFGLTHILDFFYRRVKRIAPLYFLAILGILVSLRFASVSIRAANIQPSFVATIFSTNLVKPSGIEGYFEKLGVAVDLFTHTWSLALEMQFYLLFPIIFIIYKYIPHRFSMFYIYIISLVSFIFYYTSDSFTSFNSVFSRIWQFNAGMLSYLAANKQNNRDTGKEDQMPFIEENDREKKENNNSLLVNYCLVAVLALVLSPEAIFHHFARINATVLTMLILQYGHRNPLLENRILVFIGEISYAWYLVHWPIVAYGRVLQMNSVTDILICILFSFVIAVAVHFLFERKYLKWEKSSILGVIIVLLILIVAEMALIKESVPTDKMTDLGRVQVIGGGTATNSSKFNYPSDFMGNIIYGYEHLNTTERIKLNNVNQASDLKRTLESFCKSFKKVKNPKEYRCEMNEGANKKAKQKLLVVGNSWASNIMTVVASECRQNFSHIEVSFTGGCEALAHSDSSKYFDCSYDYMFLDAIKEVQPDVLFVVDRHIQMMEIKNGTNPFDDYHFKTASDRLAEMEKHVKKKIFVLDAFPETSTNIMRDVNNKLGKNSTLKDASLAPMTYRFLIARLRLQRLVQNCAKCKLFDYTTQFFFDGQLKIYDPKYFVSFFTKGQHLTPSGWERVRPLVKHICHNGLSY